MSAGIAAHVAALRTGDDAAKEAAALALWRLACGEAANGVVIRVAIAEAGAIPPRSRATARGTPRRGRRTRSPR